MSDVPARSFDIVEEEEVIGPVAPLEPPLAISENPQDVMPLQDASEVVAASSCTDAEEKTDRMIAAEDLAPHVDAARAPQRVSQVEDLLSAQREMLTEVEHMIRAVIYEEEHTLVSRLAEHTRVVVSMQWLHEQLMSLSADEEQRRFVVAGGENMSWCWLQDEERDCREAAAISLLKTSGDKLLDAGVAGDCDPSSARVATPIDESSAVPEKDCDTAAVIEEKDAGGDALLGDQEVAGHVSPAEGPSQSASEVLHPEVEEVLLRFVHDYRLRIEQEEFEQRDVISIEMELDRDECAADARQAPRSTDNEYPDHHRQPTADNIDRSSYTPKLAPSLNQLDAIEQYLDTAHRDGAKRHDDFHMRRYHHSLVPRELWDVPVQPSERYQQLTTAEQYERLDIAKRWGYVARKLMDVRSDPEGLCELLSAMKMRGSLVTTHEVFPTGITPLPYGHVVGTTTSAVPFKSLEAPLYTAVSPEECYGDVVPLGMQRVVVPDASRMHDNEEPSGRDEEEAMRADLSDETDEAVIAAHLEVKRQLRLRELLQRMQDTEDEECVERELVSESANDERLKLVELFASCVVDEFDWSLSGYRYRIRKVPVLAPPLLVTPLKQQHTMTASEYRNAQTEPVFMTEKDRHLPMHLRTPGPRLFPTSTSRMGTSALAPSPPPHSRMGGVSSMSRLSVGSNKGHRSVSRLADLMHVTGPCSPRSGFTPMPPPPHGGSRMMLLQPIGGFQ